MDTNRVVFTVINSNEEGYNLLGIFDTLAGAQAAADEYNRSGKESLRELFVNDSPEEMDKHMEFFDWWDAAKVVEITMNTMRR